MYAQLTKHIHIFLNGHQMFYRVLSNSNYGQLADIGTTS